MTASTRLFISLPCKWSIGSKQAWLVFQLDSSFLADLDFTLEDCIAHLTSVLGIGLWPSHFHAKL